MKERRRVEKRRRKGRRTQRGRNVTKRDEAEAMCGRRARKQMGGGADLEMAFWAADLRN